MSILEGRSGAHALRFGLALLVLAAAACAHTPPASRPTEEPAAAERARAPIPNLYRPRDQRAARHMLERAFGAASEGEVQLSAALFHAVLASDFLTDKGRANIYWVTAGLHRRLGDREGEADALGAFLVASDLLPDDPELETRRLVARSVLAAMRVEDNPSLGRTPEAAIVVEDTREPASIVASLPCGDNGQGRYIEVAIESVEHRGERLLHRRAECKASGAVLDLWFDLTWAESLED